MLRYASFAATLIVVGTGLVARADSDLEIVSEFVENHCVHCHEGEEAERGFALTDLANSWRADATTRATADHWEKTLLRIQSRQMPPPDSDAPEEAEYEAVESAMIRLLDAYSTEHPFAGDTAPLRRMTRTEYGNAIFDLLGIRIDAKTILPPDASSDGFDNITVGELSPLLIDRYLTAATRVSRAVIGTNIDKPEGITVRIPADQSQEGHVNGLPLGTRGGTLLEHHFPRTGVYEIQVRLTRDRDERIEGLSGSHKLDLLVDRKREHRFELKPLRGGQDHSRYDANLNARISVEAGTHKIGVTFVEKSTPLMEIKREPFDASFNRHRHPRRSPAIHEVSIVGPFEIDRSSDSPESIVRQRLFVSRPNSELGPTAAARQVFSRLIRIAYRRPIDDSDLAVPMQFFEQSLRSNEDLAPDDQFDVAIEAGLTSILVNPNFLFRSSEQPPGVDPDQVYPIPPVELASRLSFFLWSSLPDESLLSVAEDGTLVDANVLASQARRMLTDARSKSLVDSFADQWLYLRNLPTITPDLRKFPDFDNNLRDAFAEETKLLFADVIRRDASVLELIRSDYTFLNDRLAEHYGIPGVVGSHFRRVKLKPEWHRGGLLRHGSILTATSYATRTSPTIRGAWVLENILGTPPPPPPPNVPAIKEDSSSDIPLSFRAMLAKHREDSTCASCHDLIDPVGFSLDRYDAVGRWRLTVEGDPIDANGRLPDGQIVDGVTELEQGILKRPELFVMALTEKLMTYALGRPLTEADRPAIRRIVRDASHHNYRFSDLITGITRSPPFLMRTSQ